MTKSEFREQGKALRKQVPRSKHGVWMPAADRPNPITLLQAQDVGRLSHLLPYKYGRMLESPFAFLRGSAAVMAADLANTPSTGKNVVLCGDAHLSNFGVFATPEREFVFDINDFDEAHPGPWEWDLKRLAASAVVAGRQNGFKNKVCRRLAATVATSYRKAIYRFSKMSTMDVWYFHVDAEDVLAVFEERSSTKGRLGAARMLERARKRTQAQTLDKLTEMIGGRRRFISRPPLLVPFNEDSIPIMMMGQEGAPMQPKQNDALLFTRDSAEHAWRGYLESLPDERRFLLQRFRIVDGALRVGGVGSVGTRCSILLLEGGDSKEDALILQLKEARTSALEAYLPKRSYSISYKQQAERVVTGQRLMQAASDLFLGWHTSLVTDTDYYWRQLKDMKGSVDVAALDEDGLQAYVGVCSVCLARAHARTGNEAAIAGYLGSSDVFSKAISDFAIAYADQTERDHQLLVEAVASGRVAVEIED